MYNKILYLICLILLIIIYIFVSYKNPKIEKFENYSKMGNLQVSPPQKYYCWNFVKKRCDEHDYNPLFPTANSCGPGFISQYPLPVYLDKEKCYKENQPCKNLSKEECLKDSRCGFCTNRFGKFGEGVCLPSTPSGPNNILFPCWPSKGKEKNSYFQGTPNPFKGVVIF